MKPTEVSAIVKQHCVILGNLSRFELADLILACEKSDDFHASAFAGKRKQAGYSWREYCFSAASMCRQ